MLLPIADNLMRKALSCRRQSVFSFAIPGLLILAAVSPARAADPVPSLSTDKSTYLTNEKIVITYANMLGDPGDYITVLWASAPDSSWSGPCFQHLSSAKAGTITCGPFPLGSYQVRAVFANQDGNVRVRVGFNTVEPVPVLTTDKAAYLTNQSIVVTFSNVYGDSGDYITLQPAGAPTAAYAPYYQHMSGAKSGTLTFNPLTPGQWEARVIYRNEDGNIQGRTRFTVAEPVPVLQTDKTAYQTTDKIVVTFSNVFGDPGDYITLQPAGAPAAAYAPYYQHMGGAKSGTLTFSPLTAGQWEARVIYRNEDGNIQGREGFKVVSSVTCPASLSPGSAPAPASGGSGSLGVTAATGCNWTAQPDKSWIHITSGASGSANGTVTYTVDANASLSRTGSITVTGGTQTVDSQTFPIIQSSSNGGTPVTINNPGFETLPSNPQWIDCAGSGGPGSGGTGCQDTTDGIIPGWTTAGAGPAGLFQPGPNYLNVPLPAGNGQTVAYTNGGTISQTLSATLQPNTLYTLNVDVARRKDQASLWPTPPPTVQLFAGTTLIASATGATPDLGSWSTWTGTYQSPATDPLAGQALRIVLTVTAPEGIFDNVQLTASAVTPTACTYSINPTSAQATAAGSTGSFAVTAGTGCAWTATSNNPNWLAAASTGSGSGTVNYTVAANITTASRTGTITVGGQTFTVTQAAGSGNTSITIDNPSFETLPSNPQWISNCGTGCRDTGDGNVPGWTASVTTGIGLFQPGPDLFTLPLPATEGQTVVYLNGGTLSQTLSATLQASTAYTLQVDVGRRMDNAYSSPSPTAQLFVGNTLIASATGPEPPLGGWTTWTGAYQSGASDPPAGQALKIVLGANAPQGDFDNVRLTSAPGSGAVSGGQTTITITEYPIPTAGAAPSEVTVGPDGALWFTENVGGNKIGRITTSGIITEYPVPTPGSGPWGIAAGPDGALWFTEEYGSKIGRITTSGAVTEFATPTGNSYPDGITVGPDGALWFTEWNGNKIGRIATSGAVTEYATPTGGSNPYRITVGPDGALWFTEYGGSKIGRITTSGAITEYPTPTAASWPLGIAVGPDGALWFAEWNGNKIGRITTSGSISEYPVPTAGSNPSGIVLGPDGALWFTEDAGDKIGRITTGGAITEYPVPTAKAGPFLITLGPDGALWFTESTVTRIGRLAISGSTSTPGAAAIGFNSAALTFNDDTIPRIIGWDFTPSTPVTVNALGFWASSAAGLAVSHDVIVYSDSDQSVVIPKTTVPSGCTPEKTFCYVAVAPVPLSAGTKYVIVGSWPPNTTDGLTGSPQWTAGGKTYGVSSITADSRITTGQGRYTPYTSTLAFPNSSAAILYFGPNMKLSSAAPTCTYSINPTSASVGSAASTGSFAVTAAAGCMWSAASNAPAWLTTTSSGSGNGTVSYSVTANTATTSRTGAITIGGQTFTVTQAATTPCTYSLSPTTASVGSGASSGSFNVTAGSGCTWTATSNNTDWITTTSSGAGPGTVNYSVAANTSTSSRTGSITVSGQTFTVTQAGAAPCTYSLSPTSASVGSGAISGSFNVTAGSGCAWTATSNNTAWITTTSSGTGTGTVNYSVAANSTTSSRTGSITVVGQTFTVTQAAAPPASCDYSLSETSISNMPGNGFNTSIWVTTESGCAWTASSNADWITIAGGSTGNGNGEVDLTASANPTAVNRTGTLTIAGQTITVMQDAGTPPAGAPNVTGVANAASLTPATLPGGGIAQGAIFSIIGSSLGPGNPADPTTGIAASAPLAASLANVSVQVAQGSTSMTAWPLFAWTGRVDAIMPSNMPLGSVTITLTYNGTASLLIPATVVASNFGAYSTNGTSGGRGVILLQSSASGPGVQNTTQVTAMPGQTVTLLGTGLGPVNAPDNTSPPVDDMSVPLQVLVGGKIATPLHAGRAANQPGKDRIQFVVPADAPPGCNTPVQVVTGGNIYSNVVTLSIDPNGQPCSTINPWSSLADQGGKLGNIFLLRLNASATVEAGQPPIGFLLDDGLAAFTNSPAGGGPLLSLLASIPTLGTCGALGGSVNAASLLGGSTSGAPGTAAIAYLDAGPAINIVGPAGQGQLTLGTNDDGTPIAPPSSYGGVLGGGLGALFGGSNPPPFLEPGDYTISGTGGNDIGPFTTTFTMPPPVTWSNKDATTAVDRTAGVSLAWSSGDASQLVMVAGMSSDSNTNASTGFVCVVPASQGALTVPPAALANLPVTGPAGSSSTLGALLVGTVPAGAAGKFTASGLDSGLVVYGSFDLQTVEIK